METQSGRNRGHHHLWFLDHLQIGELVGQEAGQEQPVGALGIGPQLLGRTVEAVAEQLHHHRRVGESAIDAHQPRPTPGQHLLGVRQGESGLCDEPEEFALEP